MYVKTRLLISVIICILAVPSVWPENLFIGGEDNWEALLIRDNISTRPVRGGYSKISLSDREYVSGPETELLLHFNKDFSDESGLYTVKKNTGVSISTYIRHRGSGSAAFPGDEEYFELIPDENASFAAGSGKISDFTIEFWLNPSRLSEGETVLRWTGALKTPEETLQQEIRCAVSGRNLFWEFRNFFITPEMTETVFRLTSTRALIPKRWHHHMVRYDSSTGLLEYLIDGRPEDITYANRDGKESQEVYFPMAGASKPAKFIIGRGYTGFIDELRITNRFEENPELSRYSLSSGTAATKVFDLEYSDSRFKKISSKEQTPGQTKIYYYYRISNKYFNPEDEYPSWVQFSPDELLDPGVRGRYLQIMVELFPDGTLAQAPVLSSLDIQYELNLPPMSPGWVSAVPGNGKVIINWKPVTDSDVAGYRIYYGNRPGHYFGTDSSSGISPVDVGNVNSVEIKGLENGKLYYFAVTSYDNAEIPHESVFSREITARPAAIIGENE